MTPAADLLRKIDFFEALNSKIITQIARLCAELDYSGGDYIVKQGDTGLGLFFILKGSVKVDVEKNATRINVATLRPGDFFGELSLIDNKPRSAHVICIEDTHCLVLTRDSFVKLVDKYPEIGLQIATALAGRLRAANEKLGERPGAQEAVPSVPTLEAASAAPEPSPPEQEQTSVIPGKQQVRDFLVSSFGFIYMFKAMTRFSAALIGCPVRVEPLAPRPDVAQRVVHGVKLVLFPAAEDEVIRILPFDDGVYTATIMRPAESSAGCALYTLKGRVCRNQTLYLHVPQAADPWIEPSTLSHSSDQSD